MSDLTTQIEALKTSDTSQNTSISDLSSQITAEAVTRASADASLLSQIGSGSAGGGYSPKQSVWIIDPTIPNPSIDSPALPWASIKLLVDNLSDSVVWNASTLRWEFLEAGTYFVESSIGIGFANGLYFSGHTSTETPDASNLTPFHYAINLGLGFVVAAVGDWVQIEEAAVQPTQFEFARFIRDASQPDGSTVRIINNLWHVKITSARIA